MGYALAAASASAVKETLLLGELNIQYARMGL